MAAEPPDDPFDQDPYQPDPDGPTGDAVRRTWRPVDLSTVLDGSWKAPEPTIGRRDDGRGLFYPGKAHTVVSETEGGKTWLSTACALTEMDRGNHVVYIDFEDDEGSITNRLLILGAQRELIRAQFHYVRPEESLLMGSSVADLDDLLATHRPTLAVLDGVTEGMALHGLDPNKNPDAALFGRMLTKRLTDAGAAAVSLDHVVKDRENRGRYALGAVHKINGLTGAQYILTNTQPFGVGLTGRSKLAIAKDRPGRLRVNALPSAGGLHWYGNLVVQSHGDGLAEVTIEPPHERTDDFRPTVLMERISEALAEHGPLAQRRIVAAVTGKTDSIRAAIDYLILDGYVTEKTPHELIKPYQEAQS